MEDKYSPSPGDKDLIKRCEAMFDMAKKSRQDTEKFSEQWLSTTTKMV